MLFDAAIEVFGKTDYTDFNVTVVTTANRLYINGSMGQTAPRDDNPELVDRLN